MGVGPAVAIPAAVKQAGLTLDDIDVYEINEAFASQALYCVRELGIDPEKVRHCQAVYGVGVSYGWPAWI
jgi:acetyl-CoA acetyltransferase